MAVKVLKAIRAANKSKNIVRTKNTFKVEVVKKYILAFILLFSANVNAIFLVKDANIVEIGNAAGNGSLFYIKVEGGSGPCAGKTLDFSNQLQVMKRSLCMHLVWH